MTCPHCQTLLLERSYCNFQAARIYIFACPGCNADVRVTWRKGSEGRVKPPKARTDGFEANLAGKPK